jgi:hypothetical protein
VTAGGGFGPVGYAHPAYARALAEFGRPIALDASRGWLLERPIPGTEERDAIGPYPLFACGDWPALRADLDSLAGRLVSVTLVTDPFGAYDEALLKSIFDVVRRFKKHFVVDLAESDRAVASKHHRYYARRALRELRVEVSTKPEAHVEEWTRLYSGLIARHGIEGIRSFSAAAFDAQMRVPGVVLFRALHGETVVGEHLWYAPSRPEGSICLEDSEGNSGGVAYSHLAATTESGYSLGAAYALHWAALEHFRGRLRWLDLGGGAGIGEAQARDGLTEFKAGWATGSRLAYLCGRILSPERYGSLTRAATGRLAAGRNSVDYFPAYRAGEYG